MRWMLLLLAAGAVFAQSAESGRAVFRIYCSPCHGIRGQGGRGPDLTLGAYNAGDTDAALHAVISKGVPGTEMSDFGFMGDEEIGSLVAYIRSIAKRDTSGLKGDPSAGEKLFWGKGGCGQCHTVGLKGGRLGPDLTRAGRQRSLAYLRESVVAPSEDISPGYATVTAVTLEGRKVTGVERAYDNFSAQLMDASENLHSFERDKVKSLTREYRSLMPDTYGKLFPASELDHLIAYLASLKGRAE